MEGISACLIVKNEERFIERCLESIKDFVDEIVVVDTGSTDRTKEIASRFNARVFDYKWEDDFSKARNFSLDKAKYDWILSIDADESISKEDMKKTREIIDLNEAEGYYFTWRDYTNEQGVLGWKSSLNDRYDESKIALGFTENKVIRFFKNGYYFEGKIHETVENSIRKAGGKIFLSDVVIHHYGNVRSKEEIIEKKEKYIELLKDKVEKGSEEKEKYYVLYELAREQIVKGDFEEAKKNLLLSLELNPSFESLSMLGALMIKEKQYDNAEIYLKRALLIEPLNFDVHSNLGILYSERKEYLKAIKKFERALELNPRSADGFYNLAIAYSRIGKNKKAQECLEKAIELNPKYKK
jgi:tetratricopeptide (TPR) repeat protein